MKKRFILLINLIIIAFCLTGCVDVGDYSMTEEQEKQIVDYSATILAKYNKNTRSRIVDTTQQRLIDKAAAEYVKENAVLSKHEEKKDDVDDADDSMSADLGGAEGVQDIAQALGQVDGIEISYMNYEVTKVYPSSGETDGFFNMSATPGNDLMVFHFEVANRSNEVLNCNVLDIKPLFRMIVNGNDRKNALTTLLMNDLSTCDGEIEAGTSMDSVVVLEVPEGYADSVSSVSFLIKNGSEQSIIPIIQ